MIRKDTNLMMDSKQYKINKTLVNDVFYLDEAFYVNKTNKGFINDWLKAHPGEILNVKNPTSDMVIAAIKGDKDIIDELDRNLIDNKVLNYLKEKKLYHILLKYTDDQSEELCLEALYNVNSKYILHVVKEIKNKTRKICLEAIRLAPASFKYIGEEDQTEEICIEAVKRNGYLIEYVKDKTPRLINEAMKSTSVTIAFIEDQTEELCLEAIHTDSHALAHIREHTTELCLEALSVGNGKDTLAIAYMKPWQVDMKRIIKEYPLALKKYYDNDFTFLEEVNAIEIISNFPDEPFPNITCKEFMKKHENRLKLLGRIK